MEEAVVVTPQLLLSYPLWKNRCRLGIARSPRHAVERGHAENPPHDSEDSLSQEHVASELKRLHELRTGEPSDSNQNLEGGAVAPGAEESTP